MVLTEGPLGKTNLSDWRLSSSTGGGRHVWLHLPTLNEDPVDALGLATEKEHQPARKRVEQSDEERYWLGLPLKESTTAELERDAPPTRPAGRDATPDELQDAAARGFNFYKKIQSADGHWSGEYGGPMFILPGLIFAMYVTGTPIPTPWKVEIARYLANLQRTGGVDDQGWGLHIEGESTVFGTALNYVVLRILGVEKDVPMMVRARKTLHFHGGAAGIPSWGKLWLAVLNLYSWDGRHSTPPELWLQPHWSPISPTRFWIYNRTILLAMCYFSGRQWSMPINPLLTSLREELYTTPYEKINWSRQRNNIAAVDLKAPHPMVMELAFAALNIAEKVVPTVVRKKALDTCYRLMTYEDENTSYQCNAPVNKAMHTIIRWLVDGPDSPAFKRHQRKLTDFFWMTDRGLLACGTNGSQLWDAAFIGQTLYTTGLGALPEHRESTELLLQWLDEGQMREEPPFAKEMVRQRRKGAWGFSTREQGYTVSDCTAEALKAVLMLQSIPGSSQRVDRQRWRDAIDTILTMQNKDGGFAACEPTRGLHALELLNPAEVFRDIMVEYSYTECTTACLTALAMFGDYDPTYRVKDIAITKKRCLDFIASAQRPDGSFYGSWAVCFTYATMFALESFHVNGETCENSARVKQACKFLLGKQMDDGGWGEDFTSCEEKEWIQAARSQVVNTSFAILALINGHSPDHTAIRRGCELLIKRQRKDGSWDQEQVEGVFNGTCAISYPNFKFSWTVRALGEASKYLNKA